MAATPPSNSKPAGDDRNLVPVNETTAVTFDEKLNVFWRRNRTGIAAAVVIVLIAILAKGGWDYHVAQQEGDVEKDYVAATTPEQLKAFAAAHPGHTLAAIAELRVADDAYAAGKAADALSGYEKAIGVLKSGPLAARAQLGRALAKVQAGKAAEGTSELKQLANDTTQFKAIRAEAAYQLASLAADANNSADVQKYSDLVMQVDPSSPWASRAMSLRASLPAPAAPAVTTPAATGGSAKVEVKLPGKK
jgi:hypothetical protein